MELGEKWSRDIEREPWDTEGAVGYRGSRDI